MPVFVNGAQSDLAGSRNEQLRIVQHVNPLIKCMTFSGDEPMAGAYALGQARLTLTLFRVPETVTATGLMWYQSVAGDYTASNYNGVALYRLSGTTATLVASSTNDGDIWKTGVGWGSKLFTTPAAITPGIYAASTVYSRSAVVTEPSLARADVNAAAVAGKFGGTSNTMAYLGSQTSVPASVDMTAATDDTAKIFLGVI